MTSDKQAVTPRFNTFSAVIQALIYNRITVWTLTAIEVPFTPLLSLGTLDAIFQSAVSGRISALPNFPILLKEVFTPHPIFSTDLSTGCPLVAEIDEIEMCTYTLF